MDRGQAHHNIRSEEAVKFFLNIIYRFGVPNYIITDYGTNFTEKKFLDFSNVAEPPKKSGPHAPIDVSTDLR